MTKTRYLQFTYLIVLAITCWAFPLNAQKKAETTLEADFVMTRKVAVLKETLTSKGRLMLAGKGQLRWETTAPSKSILIINGANGWLHYPDLSVTKAFDMTTDPVMKIMAEQLFALTGGDITPLSSLYDIREAADGAKTLIPKSPRIKKLFQALHVVMPKAGVVSKVTLISANGDSTIIEFENTIQNAKPDPKLFTAP